MQAEKEPRVVIKISSPPEQDVTASSRQETEGAAGLTFHVFGGMRYEVRVEEGRAEGLDCRLHYVRRGARPKQGLANCRCKRARQGRYLVGKAWGGKPTMTKWFTGTGRQSRPGQVSPGPRPGPQESSRVQTPESSVKRNAYSLVGEVVQSPSPAHALSLPPPFCFRPSSIGRLADEHQDWIVCIASQLSQHKPYLDGLDGAGRDQPRLSHNSEQCQHREHQHQQQR